MHRIVSVFVLAVVMLAALAACSSEEEQEPLLIAGIPDQDVSLLEARFNNLAEYLSEETGFEVRYVPQADYAAVVTSFKQGDIHLAWYGGLTGVQARLAVPDAEAIAQRPRDAEFHSVFVAAPDSGITELADLQGKSITFGSESSTSGHLMPRSFLNDAGIDVEQDLSSISFSGSHDRTWRLVEAGSYDAGALNEAVWESRVEKGDVDLAKVDVFYRTPPYVDYHWVVNRSVDETHGEGAVAKITDALLSIDASKGGKAQEIAEAFQTDKFISTSNDNYQAIEDVARSLGVIEP